MAVAMSVSAASVTFERVPLVIHADATQHRLTVEVARTPAQRSRGLMARDSLARGCRHAVLYDDRLQPQNFWMYRTRIAWISPSSTPRGASPPSTPCSPATPAIPATARALGRAFPLPALEVNAGYFAERGIEIGDCVAWADQDDGCAVEPVRD
ncbi:DUF192 domain-containing protein [Billgrantia gudaonensis]|uniref:DUF192 domain-containing protein n=1 Tax=Billgrantia gudaonensis TaxID=376427 RepID=A0A432JKH2_9GAMM|nr:DUF192 domain-containing protein [Halomonas gudaonensis]